MDLTDFATVFLYKVLSGTLANISKDIAARLSLILMVTLWIIMGFRGERLKMKKTNLYEDMMGGDRSHRDRCRCINPVSRADFCFYIKRSS